MTRTDVRAKFLSSNYPENLRVSEELHPTETITTIYIIRHGHTEPTENGKLYNDPDVELTERGKEQAKALGEWLAKEKPDILLSSTARRVVSTASLIAEKLRIKNIPQKGLDEWSVGEWEGRTYLEVKKEDPEDYKSWASDPIKNAPPGGESIEDLHHRVRGRIKELVAEHKGKTIALVTHAGVTRSILVESLEMPVRNFWRLNISTGSVSKIDVSDSFTTVQYTNFKP